jgi:hypothetical protein
MSSLSIAESKLRWDTPGAWSQSVHVAIPLMMHAE